MMNFALVPIVLASLSSGLSRELPPTFLKGGFKAFATALPRSAGSWDNRKVSLRKKLQRLLGDLPELFTPEVTIEGKESKEGYRLERFSFDNGVGDMVYGYILIPSGHEGRGPAILYHHQHGGLYDRGKEELLKPTYGKLGFATGEALVRQGYVVLGIDAYSFGDRRFQGPAGEREEGGATEASLFKTFLWQGKTLWGMMVRDDLLALNYLCSRAEVDSGRIAAMGMSMGSTRTWWAAALDERVKVAVSVCCLTRYQNLIAHGDVRAHGIYYYVPNMLKEGIDTESVVGLIAPRAHLTLTGDSDSGSPADGVRVINAFAEHLYKLYDKAENFRGVVYEGIGHDYTPEMWEETLTWLKKHL
ncbi:MAG: acetylxylan esterase [Sedimentisphaerales bacterium]|nr:acetylxylan esterase [Sedimentisphaerales bacterium]